MLRATWTPLRTAPAEACEEDVGIVCRWGRGARGTHTAGDFHTQNGDVYDAIISSVSAEREVTAKAMMTVAWSM